MRAGLDGSDRRLWCCEALQLAANVLVVAGVDVGREYLFNDRQEVGERSNHTQWLGAIRTRKPAQSRKGECIVDNADWQPALIKLFSEQTAGTACNATGARSRTIRCE